MKKQVKSKKVKGKIGLWLMVFTFAFCLLPFDLALGATGCGYPNSLDTFPNVTTGTILTAADYNKLLCAVEQLEANFRLPNYTAATLPASPTLGQLVYVTDAANNTTCTAGGGSTRNVCVHNGIGWAVAGGGGGGGSVDLTGNYTWTGIHSWRDGNLSIVGSADQTKGIKFEVDGLPSSTMRTYTTPNASTNLLGGSDIGVTVQGFPALISGVFSLTSSIRPAQITSNQNNYNPSGCSAATILFISTDAARDITGLNCGLGTGRTLMIYNIGVNSANLVNASASSTANLRFAFTGDITLAGGQGVILQYDSDASALKWRAASGVSGGGSTGTFTGLVIGNIQSSGQSSFTGTLLIPGKADPGTPVVNEIWRNTEDFKWYTAATIQRAIRDTNFAGSGPGLMNRTGAAAYSVLAPTDNTILVGNGTVWENKDLGTSCQPSTGKALGWDPGTNAFNCDTVATSGLASVTEDANSVNIAKPMEIGVQTNPVDLVRGGSITAARTYTLNRDVSGDVAVTTGTLTTDNLTKLAASGALVRAGPAFKVHQFMIGAEDGPVLLDTNDQPSIFYNHWGQGVTITEVFCESDAGSPTINLQRDDGTPANILSASLTCTTGGATSTTFSGTENQIASTNRVDFTLVAAGGVAKRILVSFRYTMD